MGAPPPQNFTPVLGQMLGTQLPDGRGWQSCAAVEFDHRENLPIDDRAVSEERRPCSSPAIAGICGCPCVPHGGFHRAGNSTKFRVLPCWLRRGQPPRVARLVPRRGSAPESADAFGAANQRRGFHGRCRAGSWLALFGWYGIGRGLLRGNSAGRHQLAEALHGIFLAFQICVQIHGL